MANSISSVIRTHLQTWKSSSFGQSLWEPPPTGTLKITFNRCCYKDSFAVTAAVLSNSSGEFAKKLPSTDVNKGEAMAALTSIDLAISQGCNNLMFEGDFRCNRIQRPSL